VVVSKILAKHNANQESLVPCQLLDHRSYKMLVEFLVVFNILMIFDIDSLHFGDLFEQLCATWFLVFVQKSWI